MRCMTHPNKTSCKWQKITFVICWSWKCWNYKLWNDVVLNCLKFCPWKINNYLEILCFLHVSICNIFIGQYLKKCSGDLRCSFDDKKVRVMTKSFGTNALPFVLALCFVPDVQLNPLSPSNTEKFTQFQPCFN